MALGTLATLTSRFSVVRFSGVAQEEAGGLLGGLAVVVLQDVCARLQEKPMLAWPMRSLTIFG